MDTSTYAGKRVVVMGLGHFGGGIAVSRWLAEQGARVTVTDLANEKKLAEAVTELADLPLTLHLGGHTTSDLDDCDLLVISPAVPKDKSAFVAEALRRRIPISSEMNLFLERCPARRIVGITGSAGKSTTTAMFGAILKAAFPGEAGPRGWMGGNIGKSLLAELPRMGSEDVVALELSSFQLEDSARLAWSPHLALITNIQPNHLDRHGTFEAYADAKMNIVRFQKGTDSVYVHAADEALAERVKAVGAAGRLVRYDFDPAFAGDLQLPGRHNRMNAAGAIALARGLGIDDAVIREGLASFYGLPHRLEFVGEVDGVRYYNDSKSTTAESTQIALEAFDEPVVMMVGGRGKGAPFDDLSRRLVEKAKAVVPYGETAPIFAELLGRFSRELNRPIPVRTAARFDEAMSHARELAQPGDVVVLSPACTSYDLFNNYEERGDAFRQAVGNMSRETSKRQNVKTSKAE